jgi:hypothetical protein
VTILRKDRIMPSIESGFIKIELKKRSLLGRIFQFPKVLITQYQILRRKNGFLTSFKAAWALASMIIVMSKKID